MYDGIDIDEKESFLIFFRPLNFDRNKDDNIEKEINVDAWCFYLQNNEERSFFPHLSGRW